MGRSRLTTGAQVLVYINGHAFGRVADLSWDSETPRRVMKVVDSISPAELIPEAVTITGSMTIYKLHKDGGIEAAGLSATWDDLTREKYFSIMVLDRITDTVVFKADKCSVTRQSWRLAKGYVMGQISFTALKWSNETEPSAT